MAKKKKKTKPTKEKEAEESAASEADMPEGTAQLKAKLEAETGKKYRYRPKGATPSIPDMLAHGAPEDNNKPSTFLEVLAFPAILTVLFVVSFLLFVRFVPYQHAKNFKLPTSEGQDMPEQQQYHQQQGLPLVKEADAGNGEL